MQHNGSQALLAWRLCGFMSEGRAMLAVQQLLVKGLFKQETELATVQVLPEFLPTALRSSESPSSQQFARV